MPDAVADTHSLIWYLEDDPRLGPEADRTFEACDRGELLIYLPTILPGGNRVPARDEYLGLQRFLLEHPAQLA